MLQNGGGAPMPTPADYERLQMDANTPPTHRFPGIERTWTIGTVIAAIGSVVTVVTVIVGLVWGYAGISYSTQKIPSLEQTVAAHAQQQEIDVRDIAVLKSQQANNATQYGQIMAQLGSLGDKLDQLNQQKADKRYAQ